MKIFQSTIVRFILVLINLLDGVAEGCVVLLQGLVLGGDGEEGDSDEKNGDTDDEGDLLLIFF